MDARLRLPGRSIEERFFAGIEADPNGGCWFWGAASDGHGYGVMNVMGTVEKTHRLSWRLFRGEIPDGLHVLHRCDTPPCVNPVHLFLGTPADNSADKHSKGRDNPSRGSDHFRAKLTEEAAVAIVQEVRRGRTHRDIGREYGISHAVVGEIARGNAWKHATAI